MPARIPNNFQTTQDSAIASFNYIDLVSGQGYRTFYPVGFKTIAATFQYGFTSEAIDSDINNYTDYSSTAHERDIDFDSGNIDYPFIIAEGIAYIQATVGTDQATSGTFTMKLIKYDGSSETEIGTVTVQIPTAASTQRLSFKMTTARTKLNVGDILRFNLTTSHTNGKGIYYWDGGGRLTVTETASSATIPSNIEVSIPFAIDI